MPTESADILILGAGAAGLAAARDLSNAGRSLILLEARSRVGGRIHTAHDPAFALPVELGAEFVHGRPESTWEILRSVPARPYDVTDTHWYYQSGKLQKKDFWSDTEKVLSKLERVGKRDCSFADFLKTYAKSSSPTARAMATSFVEGFNAADRNRVSSLFLKDAQSAAGEIDEMTAFRLAGGYDQVPGVLLSSLDPRLTRLHLSTIAHTVKWSKGDVRVTAIGPAGDARHYHAKSLVVTLPLGVLRSPPGSPGSVTFDPPLPDKEKAWSQMVMGPVVKIIANFREPFWEGRDELKDLGYLHAPDDPFPTSWTTLPMRTATLTGWAGGPAADRLSALPPPAVLDAFLSTLAAPLQTPKAKLSALLQSYHVADWQSDPFSRGAYSYALVGGSGAAAALAKPVAGTVFFAGEHTHALETGSVAAALETGQRAAKQLLSAR